MRILYIVTAFPRSTDDVITPWLSETIERLRLVGVEVEVLAPSYRGLGEQTIDGTRVHRFRYAPAGVEALTHDQTTPDRLREHPLSFALVPGYLLAGTLAATRLARTGRFDVVHAFWPLPHGVFGIAARRFSGVPLVSTFFGVELRWLRRRLPFLSAILRKIIRGSDAVTVISSHTAAEVRALEPDIPVRVIPFGAAAEPAEHVAAYAPPIPPSLLFVGRLVERKGVRVLLRALAEPGLSDVRLRIVGDGPEKSRLEALAGSLGLADRVAFAGFVPEAELSAELSACTALVLPAMEDAKGDVEGLGVVLIEALAHGRPVIASRSGGIPDIVEDGRTGLLVPPGDVGALAAAIRRLVDDPTLAARLAEEGRQRVTERFSWDRIVAQLVETYREVSAGAAVPGADPRAPGGRG